VRGHCASRGTQKQSVNAWSSYCSLTEGGACLWRGWHGDHTPTTIGDIGSVEQIDAPTDIDVCPAVSGSKDKHVQ